MNLYISSDFNHRLERLLKIYTSLVLLTNEWNRIKSVVIKLHSTRCQNIHDFSSFFRRSRCPEPEIVCVVCVVAFQWKNVSVVSLQRLNYKHGRNGLGSGWCFCWRATIFWPRLRCNWSPRSGEFSRKTWNQIRLSSRYRATLRIMAKFLIRSWLVSTVGSSAGWRRNQTIQTNQELPELPAYTWLLCFWGNPNIYVTSLKVLTIISKIARMSSFLNFRLTSWGMNLNALQPGSPWISSAWRGKP